MIKEIENTNYIDNEGHLIVWNIAIAKEKEIHNIAAKYGYTAKESYCNNNQKFEKII